MDKDWITHPGSFNCPDRIPTAGSLSRTPPNLMYDGSSAFRNLSFVDLSKQSVILEMSSEVPNRDFASFSVEIIGVYQYKDDSKKIRVLHYLAGIYELGGSRIQILVSGLLSRTTVEQEASF